MQLSELLSAWRLRVHDLRPRYLWSDDEGKRFANEAVNEAAERAKLIFDATSDEVCRIVGRASVASYELHASLIELTCVRFDGKTLTGTSRSALDQTRGTTWREATGAPSHYIADLEAHTLLLVGIPPEAKTITLEGYRLPLEPMVANDDEPEIAEKHHYGLIEWMAALSYRKEDTETFDAKAADIADRNFTRIFGPKTSASNWRTQRAKRTNQVRMNPGW